MPARNDNQEDEITVHRDFMALDLPYALEAAFIEITYQIYALKQSAFASQKVEQKR
jgi:hypothetical protein